MRTARLLGWWVGRHPDPFFATAGTNSLPYQKQYSGGGAIWGDVETSGGKGGKPTWSTYRWQLEAFVSKVKGRQPACWVSGEEKRCSNGDNRPGLSEGGITDATRQLVGHAILVLKTQGR